MLDFEKRLASIAQQTILCVGDLMLDDFVYGEVARISPEAPAPVLAVKRNEIAIGGAGNVARNIASLGARCIFVGVVGDDEAGRDVIARLQAEPLDRTLIGRRSYAPDDARKCASSANISPLICCAPTGRSPGRSMPTARAN